MKLIFVTLCISIFLCTLYFVYFMQYKEDISDDSNLKSWKKILLLYIFPSISVILIIAILIYFGFIKIELAFTYAIICLFLLFGIFLFFASHPYWGVTMTILVIVAFLALSNIPFIPNTDSETKENLNLYEYSEDATREELFISFSDLHLTDSTSEITLYTFMQYDKNKKYNIPFLMENIEAEIIDNDNNHLEITTENIIKHSVLSYFGFTKPEITSNIKYKVYLNEDYIHLAN